MYSTIFIQSLIQQFLHENFMCINSMLENILLLIVKVQFLKLISISFVSSIILQFFAHFIGIYLINPISIDLL